MGKKKISDFPIADPQPELCEHDVSLVKNSLIYVPGFETYVYPMHHYFVCKYCGKSFEYIEDSKGVLTEVID